MTGVRMAIRPTTRSSRSSPAPSATSPSGPATGPQAQDGRTGYWTQSEFIELVAYAADHGIAIVPEIDGPGHSFSLLHGLAELNTGNSNPKPAAGEDTPAFIQSAQGRSSLATDADITYTVLGHIMDQLDGMIDKGIKASTMPGVRAQTHVLPPGRR